MCIIFAMDIAFEIIPPTAFWKGSWGVSYLESALASAVILPEFAEFGVIGII